LRVLASISEFRRAARAPFPPGRARPRPRRFVTGIGKGTGQLPQVGAGLGQGGRCSAGGGSGHGACRGRHVRRPTGAGSRAAPASGLHVSPAALHAPSRSTTWSICLPFLLVLFLFRAPVGGKLQRAVQDSGRGRSLLSGPGPGPRRQRGRLRAASTSTALVLIPGTRWPARFRTPWPSRRMSGRSRNQAAAKQWPASRQVRARRSVRVADLAPVIRQQLRHEQRQWQRDGQG